MKKIMITLLIFSLACCSLSCANANSDKEQTTADSSQNESTTTLTDMAGRTVEIPTEIERIVPLGNTPRMVAYLGLADQVVGISEFKEATTSPLQAYAYVNKDLWSDLPIVGSSVLGSTDYYPEALMATNADIIFCTYSKEQADDIQRQTGIPVVAVADATAFGDDYDASLRMLGDICGVSSRAEALITYIDTCLEDLNARTASISPTDNPSVLAAAATYKGVHGIDWVYTDYPVFNTIHANNLAQNLTTDALATMVDKEQILTWNPDYIFLDSSGVSLVQDAFNKSPDYFNNLHAFTSDQIYQYPNAVKYDTNLEISLVNSYYVGKILFPDQFKDIDFETEANAIFNFFLGSDDYLSVLEADGSGYAKVELGDPS